MPKPAGPKTRSRRGRPKVPVLGGGLPPEARGEPEALCRDMLAHVAGLLGYCRSCRKPACRRHRRCAVADALIRPLLDAHESAAPPSRPPASRCVP
jgi:hypothetical protein